jgi:glycerol-3-phosphate dehydrogenase
MHARAELVDHLARGAFDVCIIGGGATGLGCGLDAQLRGLRTAVVEAGDFAGATSSASTKLAHGGVRYLQQAVAHLDVREYRLVRDALRERALMLRNAPHLAHPLEFAVPCRSRFDLLYYGAGLKLYDWMAGSLRLGPSHVISRAGALQRIPALQSGGLAGAVTYVDGQFDDARFAITLLSAFLAAGGRALNYARVTGFEKSATGALQAAAVEDSIGGSQFCVRARAFVNATGPFSDAVRRLASPGAADRMEPSKGVHVLFPLGEGWKRDALLVPRTADGRVVFAIPYLGRLLVGTTDEAASPDAEPVVTRDEIDYLLEQVNPYLAAPLAAGDIVSGFAGVRPLIARGAAATKRLVRDDEMEFDARTGLISILGGKWTTYRLMAEKTIDRVQQYLGMPAGGCATRDHRLPEPWVEAALLEDDPELARPVVHGFAATLAEVAQAVRQEMAVTIEDVLRRRIGLELFSWNMAADAAPAVGECMARELGWSREATGRAIQQYVTRIRRMQDAAGLRAGQERR